MPKANPTSITWTDYPAIRARLQALAADGDPAALLAVERLRLEQACAEAFTCDEVVASPAVIAAEVAWGATVNLTSEKIGRLDEAIADIVAPTLAGIETQLWVLRQLADGVYGSCDEDHSADCADRLVASIAAAVRKLAAPSASSGPDDILALGALCTIGELVDLADRVPEDDVTQVLGPFLAEVAPMLGDPDAHFTPLTRRLVVATALVNRALFEVARLPKDRDYVIE